MKKKVRVYMLPTDSINQVEKGGMFLNDSREHNWGKLQALICERVTAHGHAWSGSGIQTYINHIYLTSDEKIEEGDWCIKSYGMRGTEELCKYSTDLGNTAKKIVATTDKSLNLPQIPQSFIKQYVEADGKIDEVEVEYEEYGHYEMTINTFNSHGYKPKIDSNNCVIVHSIEEKLYTIQDLENAWFRKGADKYTLFKEWIKENL